MTIDADLKRRLQALADAVPGGSMSGVFEDMLRGLLPIYERAIEVMKESMREDGTVDQHRARGHMAAWVTENIMRMHDTRADLEEGAKQG